MSSTTNEGRQSSESFPIQHVILGTTPTPSRSSTQTSNDVYPVRDDADSGRKLKAIQKRNTRELLESDIEKTGGAHLILMPNIETELTKAPDVCEALSRKFRIPLFFWNETGWNANGFYGSVVPDENSFVTYSRFLSKKVDARPPVSDATDFPKDWLRDEKVQATSSARRRARDLLKDLRTLPDSVKGSIKGSWHFMGLCTLFVSREDGNHTHILLCFDLNNGQDHQHDNVAGQFREEFVKDADLRNLYDEPFVLLKIAIRAVVERFDRDTWTFKRPIRDWEQHRVVLEQTGLDALTKRYENMHELSRHVIHISETLKAATRNLNALVEDQKTTVLSGLSTGSKDHVSRALKLSSNRLTNLQERAQAFVDRLHNEIQLAFNIVAAIDSDTSRAVLDQSRNDNKSFADTIALLTLFFLPGTFVSGFFGMNFFTINGDNNDWTYSKRMWIFFACTVPITTLCFMLFVLDLPIIGAIRRYVSEPVKGRIAGIGHSEAQKDSPTGGTPVRKKASVIHATLRTASGNTIDNLVDEERKQLDVERNAVTN